LDAAELILGLILLDAVQDETTFGVVQESESVSALLQFQHIHETGWVVGISSDLTVNFYATFHANLHAFLTGEGVLQTFTEDDGHGEALTLLMRTGRGLRGPDTSHFGEVPMAGRIETLEMFLRSARHLVLLISDY
jgi:hypothetical protein